jgi:NADPH2:quinone reductase
MSFSWISPVSLDGDEALQASRIPYLAVYGQIHPGLGFVVITFYRYHGMRRGSMKAVLCKSYGPPEALVVEEIAPPKADDEGVLIEVHAAGVNFADTLIIQNKYQMKPPLPFSPGSEVSGVVLETGKKVQAIKPGDRVLAITGWGGYAEQAVAHASTVYPIPENMNMTQAASIPTVYGTSLYALKQRGSLRAGETLLVLGATGGVGLTAVELGKLMGARVIAAGGSDEKLSIAAEYGADYLINYREKSIKDEVKEVTGGQGADVIYDPVGGDAFDQAMGCINWNGRLLVVGFASGRIPEVAVHRVMNKGCQIVGVLWGATLLREPETNRRNFEEMLAWFSQGKLRPCVSNVIPMAWAAKALGLLLERISIGKVVLSMRNP